MKNYRKMVITTVIVVALMLSLSLTMYADDFKINATPDISSVTAGSRFTLTVSADMKLFAAEVHLAYDDSVLSLEKITSNVESFDGKIASSGKKITYTYDAGVSSKEMFTLHFLIKSGVYDVDELTIRFQNIVATRQVGEGFNFQTVTTSDYEWRYTICRNHVWQTVTQTNATCTEDGIRNSKCANCPETKTEVWEVKKGHDYLKTVTDPTCTEEGFTYNKCSRCTSNYKSDIKDALGHDYKNEGSTSTCGKLGQTEYKCTVCQSSYKVDDTEKPAHNYETVTTESTCNVLGKDVHTCKECGDVKVDEHKELGAHKYENKVTEPTCTEEGKTVIICSVCGNVNGEFPINATGHSFGNWKTEIAPTTEKEGIAKRSCEDCGHSETQKLDKLISTNPANTGDSTTGETESSWMGVLIIILVIGILILGTLLVVTYVTFKKKREAR